jgi:hypothetical protein
MRKRRGFFYARSARKQAEKKFENEISDAASARGMPLTWSLPGLESPSRAGQVGRERVNVLYRRRPRGEPMPGPGKSLLVPLRGVLDLVAGFFDILAGTLDGVATGEEQRAKRSEESEGEEQFGFHMRE